jgi:hypothetical protein
MAAPVVYYVANKIAPAAGNPNRIIQVVGHDFTLTATVTVGALTPTVVEPVSQFLLQCNTPAHAAGPVDVVVTTAGGSGTAVGAVTYI